MGGGDTGDLKAEDRADRVVAAILSYLASQRAAADTARGIREWWLRGLRPPATIAEVEVALARLESAGTMRRTVNRDRTVLWSAILQPRAADP